MEAVFNTLSDIQRVETLNGLYQKGLSVSKEKLAFSADKLVYVKPFMNRLQDSRSQDLNSRLMVRQIIDELLQDIVFEIEATCTKDASKDGISVMTEYGLQYSVSEVNEAVQYNQVA